MKARLAAALVAALVASTAAQAEKLSDDFRAEFQRQIHKKTYAVVVQKGIPTVPINGMDNEQYGAATFGVDVLGPSEWKPSMGLLDTNQQVAAFLDVGELLEVVDVTFKDNRVDLRTVSRRRRRSPRGLDPEDREARDRLDQLQVLPSRRMEVTLPDREDVPAVLDYVSPGSGRSPMRPRPGSSRRRSSAVRCR